MASQEIASHESQSAIPSATSSRQISPAAQLNGADAVKAAVEAGARELERRAGGAIMPGRLLLTVSDAARMAQINALIRSAGYEARAAFDGQQALDLLRIERPDLLLLDYQLHGMDGVETLRRLRKQSGGRLKLPVILLLPPDHELARQEALELGARDVVTTPYDPAELLTSVRLAGNAE
jgi:CheY-like chemotaxis protein